MKYSVPHPVVGKGEKTKKIIPVDAETLKKIEINKNLPLVFSFKYFDREHELFNLGGICNSWFASLFDILKDLSDTTEIQLHTTKKDRYYPHSISWDEVHAKFNFDDEWLEQHECLQIYVSKAMGRIQGFIVSNYFYIVWLDPYHNLYPIHSGKSFGGEKRKEPLLSCNQILCSRILELEAEVKEDNEVISTMCDECTHNQ